MTGYPTLNTRLRIVKSICQPTGMFCIHCQSPHTLESFSCNFREASQVVPFLSLIFFLSFLFAIKRKESVQLRFILCHP